MATGVGTCEKRRADQCSAYGQLSSRYAEDGQVQRKAEKCPHHQRTAAGVETWEKRQAHQGAT